MLKSEIIGPVGSGGPLETGHVICPACAHNFPAIPENARDRMTELEAALSAIIERWDTPLWKDVEPTGSVICRARDVLQKPWNAK